MRRRGGRWLAVLLFRPFWGQLHSADDVENGSFCVALIMNVLAEIRHRFTSPVASLVTDANQRRELLEMIRPAQDARFGDYQANLAMPLGKQLGKSPRDVAAELVAHAELADMFETPEIAGPGFINLRLKNDRLAAHLKQCLGEVRLGVPLAQPPRTYVIDYSSPNVAKPMHVGHIRSTVIGDALYRILGFLGHQVISDNHLGDWGTQFGMIIYGYKHFVDRAAFDREPVKELGRLYKLVHRLVDHRESVHALPKLEAQLKERIATLAEQKKQAEEIPAAEKAAAKKAAQSLKRLEGQIAEQREVIHQLHEKIAAIDLDPALAQLVGDHPQIDEAVLAETAKLHAGDPENRQLWQQFLPGCRQEIQKLYKRLHVTFDHELGESFYHDMLAPVVEQLVHTGLARESEGALCVFLPGYEAPMIIRKKDGAYLYATTDLATIQYRMSQWLPDAILYVVDHRQGDHFEKLFAAARLAGYGNVELKHVSFGTILGNDGKPYKTRSGDTVGLEGLLDEAVDRVLAIIKEKDTEGEWNLAPEQRQSVAETVGIAAIKYADLSQNRTSDYTFSYDKMVALDGNTATYMQYAFARVNGIFRRGNIAAEEVRASALPIQLTIPAERALGIQLIRFSEALAEVTVDYRPNILTSYLYDLARAFTSFFENCPVLKAETAELKMSRLMLCDLTARTIKQGLNLLGIEVAEKM
jgi:arginyl-tRNA synthetase